MNTTVRMHGLMAQFATPADLVKAARSMVEAGYRRIEAYSPMPVPGLAEALGMRSSPLSRPAVAGGLVAGLGMYAVQWFSVAVDYPINVGNRTPAWPALIPATFDMSILGAALAVFFGVLVGSSLPRLIHPAFNHAAFAAASSSGFFLCVEAADPKFDAAQARHLLEQAGSWAVEEVPA